MAGIERIRLVGGGHHGREMSVVLHVNSVEVGDAGRHEVYTRRAIHYPGDEMEYFAAHDITDKEAMRLLVVDAPMQAR